MVVIVSVIVSVIVVIVSVIVCVIIYVSRYNTSDNAVEFINDNEYSTFWESAISQQTSSLIVAQFELTISLSKVLIYFQSSPPQSLELQYYTNDSWNILQYYSIDCFDDFDTMPNKKLDNANIFVIVIILFC